MEKRKPSVIGIIPARFGSVRLPGKPLLKLEGKPIIQHTYEKAASSSSLDELIVATDDERIVEAVQAFGGKAVMTPVDCLTGTDRLSYVISELSEYSNYEVIVNIQGDEPDISKHTIDSVIETLISSKDASMASAYTKMENPEEIRKLSNVKCVFDKYGYALYFSRAPIPSGKLSDINPKAAYYKHIGIYAYRRDFLLIYPNLMPTPLQTAEDLEQLKALENGYRIKLCLVDHDSNGIDTLEDYKLRESKKCP